MKERPILFSAPMVRAILADEKSATRRMVKPQPPTEAEAEDAGCQRFALHPRVARTVKAYYCAQYDALPKESGAFDVTGSVGYVRDRCGQTEWTCPYGVPGDRLWVRETWAYKGGDEYLYQREQGAVSCRATWQEDRPVQFPDLAPFSDYVPGGKWRPSIFMPRWASRLTLEVVSVGCERLKAITDASAVAEGARFRDVGDYHDGAKRPGWSMKRPHPVDAGEPDDCLGSARFAFGSLWNEIHGDGAWDANPYVWVVEFKRVTT